jgi:hypothetical protein
MTYYDEEFEKRRKKLLGLEKKVEAVKVEKPSQQASFEQRRKQILQAETTPLVRKEEQPTEPAITEKPTLFTKVKQAVTGVVKGITNLFKPQQIVSPIPEEQIIKPGKLNITPEAQKQMESSYLKFPSIFPHPELDLIPKEEGVSAQLRPEAKDAADKFLANPLDTTIYATRDFLTYHPQVQKVVKDAAVFVDKMNREVPFFREANIGVANLIGGSSQEYRDYYEKRLPATITVESKPIDKVGGLISTTIIMLAGGSLLKGVGFTQKVALPLLFNIFSQTSAPIGTTLKQRILKVGPATLEGWLFGMFPSLRGLKGKELIKTGIKGTGMTFGTGSGASILNSLIEGKSKEEAINIAKTQGIITSLFYVAGNAMGLLGDEILKSKTAVGTRIFSPSELKIKVKDFNLENTDFGKSLIKTATEAEKSGKNIEIDWEAAKKSFVANKLGLETPEGAGYTAKLTDKAPQIAPTLTEETKTTKMPAVITEEIQKREGKTIQAEKSTPKVFYRGGGQGEVVKGKTAQEIVNYEVKELGNKDIKAEPGIDLTKIPSDKLVWLTETKEAAKEYGKVEEVKLENYRVVARDSSGGVLVEKVTSVSPTPPPVKPTTPIEVKPAQPPVEKGGEVVTKEIPKTPELEKSYSADIIASKNQIHKPVEVNGKLYIATEGFGKEVTEVIPVSEFKGETTTYTTKEITDKMRTENTFYEGMKVNYGKNEYVLGKSYNTETLIKPIKPTKPTTAEVAKLVEPIKPVKKNIPETTYIDKLRTLTLTEQYAPRELNTKVDFPGRPDTTIDDLITLYPKSLTKENIDDLLNGNKTELLFKDQKITIEPIGVKQEVKQPTKVVSKKATTVTPSKIAPEKIYISLNKIAGRQLPVIDNIRVKEGKMYFTDLQTEVVVNTDKPDGFYKVIGKDFNPLKGIDSKDYVVPQPELKEEVGLILSENLISAIKKHSIFVNTDSQRPILNGINFKIEGNLLKTASTDGYRLYFNEQPLKGIKDTSFIISGLKDISSTIGVLGEAKTSIKVGDKKQGVISFTNDNARITTRKFEGEFPKYESIYPNYQKRVVIDKNSLVEAIKSLKPYAKESANIVSLEFKDNEIILKSKNEAGIEKKVTVKIHKTINVNTPEKVAMPGSLIMTIKTPDLPDNSLTLNIKYLEDSVKISERNELFLDLAFDTFKRGKETKLSQLKPVHISDKEEPFTPSPEINIVSEIDKAETKLKTKISKSEFSQIKTTGENSSDQEYLNTLQTHLSVEKINEKKPGKKPTSTTGYGSTGGYANLNNLSKARAIEFPEMVRLARELMGEFPIVKKIRSKRGYAGMFRPKEGGRIELIPELFKDPEQAAKTLAHEIGHLADYLPEKTLKRGSIINRVAGITREIKNSMGNLDKKDLNKEMRGLRAELKKLTQIWKPFEEDADPGFTKYRYSSVELYADAVSVLFNDPDFLKENAPIFWDNFFTNLDKKPEFKTQFFDTWDLLNSDRQEVLRVRQEEIRKAFKRGEDQFSVLRAEKNKRRKDYVFMAKYLLVEKGQKIYDYVKEAKKKGIPINDDQNPNYWFEEQKYVGGEVKAWVEENIQPVYKAVTDKVSWEDFGELLFHERVINERGELANPLGFSPETSKEQETYLQKKLGEEGWKVLQDNLPKYREAIKKVYDKGIEAGLFSEELVKTMKANPAYATFQVIDYLDTYIPAAVKHQVGTLKEIANPADSTVMKATSIIFTAERNMAKKAALEVCRSLGKIEEAKTIWTGKYHEPIESKDPDKALLTVMEMGKVKGYYVDPFIAKSFNYMDTGTIRAISEILGQRFLNSKLFRPLFITFNLGFQTFNLIRDFNRAVKAYPSRSLANSMFHILRGYTRGLKPSLKRGWGISDQDILEMEKSKMLSITYNDVILGRDEYDKQIEYIFDRAGISIFKNKEKNLIQKIVTPLTAIMDQISNLGNAIETLPKVAGYKELHGKMPPKEMASYIRRYLGSPDFMAGGAAKPLSNEVFLFSNAIAQGERSDIDIAFQNPKTRAGYWWKTAWLNLLPKVIMYAALMGLFGASMKKMMEDVSEYDKSNYTVIPLSRENGQTTHLRIPSDETGRLIGGIFWKALRIMDGQKPVLKDLSELMSFMGGQAPNLSPSIESIIATMQFLSGKNPYDSYRGRSVVGDEEFKAGGWYAWKPFLNWQVNQLGAGVFWKGFATMQTSDKKTWIQKVVEAPVMSNILGRWIRVTNYGQKEKNTDIITGLSQEESRRRLEERQLINDALSEYNSGSKNMVRRMAIEKKLIRDILGKPPYKGTDKAKETNLKKKFKIGIIKGEADQNINSIISATSNDQKVTLLQEMSKQMASDEFSKMVDTLTKEKIISKDVLKEFKKNKLQSYVPTSEEFKLLDIFKPKEAMAAEGMMSPLGIGEKPNPIPYRLDPSDREGYVNVVYPSGAVSEIKTEDLPKYGALIQENYRMFNKGEYPKTAPNWLSTQKESVLPSQKGATRTPFDKEIKEAFGDNWKEATRVLRYTNEAGEVHGENIGFQTGPEIDVANRINPETGKYDKNAPIKQVKNPFTDKQEDSIDRGLFRVNNGTFYSLLNSKDYREQMKEAGIISSSDLDSLDAATASEAWDKMLDAKLNIKMARIIWNFHNDISGNGWSGWFAAPPELLAGR